MDHVQPYQVKIGEQYKVYGIAAATSVHEEPRKDEHLFAGISHEVVGECVEVANPEEWEEIFDPARHFAVKYDRSENPERMVDPVGMSGCGAWKLRSRRGELFYPSAELVGILESYRPESKAVKLIRVEHLQRFVREEVVRRAAK